MKRPTTKTKKKKNKMLCLGGFTVVLMPWVLVGWFGILWTIQTKLFRLVLEEENYYYDPAMLTTTKRRMTILVTNNCSSNSSNNGDTADVNNIDDDVKRSDDSFPLLFLLGGGNNSITGSINNNNKGLLRFIVFQGDIPGQGIGNLMNGLLATHLLGDEFDRIVCISPAFNDFLLAFDSIHPLARQYCPLVLTAWQDQMDHDMDMDIINNRHHGKKNENMKGPQQQQQQQKQQQRHHHRRTKKRRRIYNYHQPPKEYLLKFVNYQQNKHPVDECELQSKLASNTTVWFLRTNMYPRWPTTTSNNNNIIPKNYFDRFYKPNPNLNALLESTFGRLEGQDGDDVDDGPYHSHHSNNNRRLSFPSIVVHLRKEDGPKDYRNGLDNATLQALGEHVMFLEQQQQQQQQHTSKQRRRRRRRPYLVTNHVQYYQYFETKWNWSHPPWDNVIHSVLLQQSQSQPPPPPNNMKIVDDVAASPIPRSLQQQQQNNTIINHHQQQQQQQQQQQTQNHQGNNKDYRLQQKLQLWVDWYTILKVAASSSSSSSTRGGAIIYHTFSDFSASAIHWNELTSQSSRIIKGYNTTTNTLELEVEWWRRRRKTNTNIKNQHHEQQPLPGVVLPLVERGKNDLLHCQGGAGGELSISG